MINTVISSLVNKYDKRTFSLLLPQALSDIQDEDENVELATSNTLMPVKIFYTHKTSARSIATIFIQRDTDDREFPTY